MRFALGHPDVLAGGHRVEVAAGCGEVPNDDAFWRALGDFQVLRPERATIGLKVGGCGALAPCEGTDHVFVSHLLSPWFIYNVSR